MESEEEKYAEIARKDWEREIYKQCDEEDRTENCFFCKNLIVKNLLVSPVLKCKKSNNLVARPRGLGKCDEYESLGNGEAVKEEYVARLGTNR